MKPNICSVHFIPLLKNIWFFFKLYLISSHKKCTCALYVCKHHNYNKKNEAYVPIIYIYLYTRYNKKSFSHRRWRIVLCIVFCFLSASSYFFHNFLVVVLFTGSALMNIVGVYKEIQDQHMNIVCEFMRFLLFFK